jgi:nucleotide-binding universal stress UspA family protein
MLQRLVRATVETNALAAHSSWAWNTLVKLGVPSDVILQTARQIRADLITMTTDGSEGFLDGLRGSTSERVLRKAHCPMANLPVGSMLG